MKLKLYFSFLLFLHVLNFSFAKEPVPGPRMSFFSIPELPNPIQLYNFDSTSNEWVATPLKTPLIKDFINLKNVSFDPIRFDVVSSVDSIQLGKEFEITISAEFLDVNKMLMFQFEGSNEYSLKLILPQGFVQTGGTYYDFIEGKVDKDNPIQKYTIKGYFEAAPISCFQLIRGSKGANITSTFVSKKTFCQKTFVKNYTSFETKEKSVSEIQDFCGDLSLRVNVSAILEDSYTTLNRRKIKYNLFLYRDQGGDYDRRLNSIVGGDLKLIRKRGSIEDIIATISKDDINAQSNIIATIPNNNWPNFSLSDQFYIKNNSNTNINSMAGNVSRDVIGSVNCSNINIYINNFWTSYYEPSTLNIDLPVDNPCLDYYTITPRKYHTYKMAGQPISGLKNPGDANNFLKGSNPYSVDYFGYDYINSEPSPKITVTIPAKKFISDNLSISSNKTEVCLNEAFEIEIPNILNSCPYWASLSIWKENSKYTDLGVGNRLTKHTIYGGPGIYYLQCERSCNSTIFSNQITITGKNNPPPAPLISATATTLCQSQNITLTVTNSDGSGIVWTPGNIRGKTMNVQSAGEYIATHTTACGSASNVIDIFQSTPPPPTVLSSASEVCMGDSVLLSAYNCYGTVIWSNGKTGSYIYVPMGSYTAVCSTASCGNSQLSNAKVITQKSATDCENCSTFDLKITASKTSILGGETVDISADLTDAISLQCESSNSITWRNGFGLRKSIRVSPEITTTYEATCMINGCESNVAKVTIIVEDAPPPPTTTCGDISVTASSNATSVPGSVGVGDELMLWGGASNTRTNVNNFSYQWQFNGVDIPNANQSFLFIKPVTISNTGSYKLRATDLATSTVCYSDEMIIEISACNYGAEVISAVFGNQMWVSLEFSRPCNNCTINWYHNNSLYQSGQNTYILRPIDGENRGLYYANVQIPDAPSCNFNTQVVDVKFNSNPVYAGYTNNLYCDNISGWVSDQANIEQKQDVSLVVKDMSGVEINHRVEIETEYQGGRWAYTIPFPDEFKNGISYQMAVRHNNNGYQRLNPYTFDYKTITCCKLELTELDVNCVPDSQYASIMFRYENRSVVNGMLSPLSYRISKRGADRFGEPSYIPTTGWVSINQASTSNFYVINNFQDGFYKLEVKEGSGSANNSCVKSQNFTISCVINPEEDCSNPILVVNPRDTLIQGLDLKAELVANFVNTNTSNLPTNFQNVLLSTKKTSLSLPDMQGWENSTSEAWVYPNANTHISTSYSNEGEIQRVLFKSTGSPTNLDWWLSVGCNGATLYEKNNDPTLWKHTRIALSYEVELKGWNHIAVSYLNNLPHLYINGELVA
ncbi:MAG: hypothetical protein ACRCVT_02630, partial [Leadbetterella sp.]